VTSRIKLLGAQQHVGALLALLPDGLDADFDRYLLTDQRHACFERGIEVDSIVFAIDHELALESDPGLAFLVLDRATQRLFGNSGLVSYK
jgi:hypothetical protein